MAGVQPKICTLILPHLGRTYLLGMKKRGFGEGKYNGFGGKVEKGETIRAAAVRELKEEAGIEAKDMTKKGFIHFTFEDTPDLIIDVHVYSGEIVGEPVESDEMRPQYFHEKEFPFEKMWEDDRYWLPLFFQGKSFEGEFHFKTQSSLKRFHLREVPSTYFDQNE
mmetsp:Transcript_8652/g.23271  ORF Transcript_8652/g.23271 Transcript_8652/m.23271 type:complete len:165 (-) Transcript_8652:2536-3030(-)